jgi:hypothetical protein
MADRYRSDDYEWDEERRQYRGQREGTGYNGGERYPGGYEGARSGRYDDERYRDRETAPGGRYGQGQSFSRYGQQGWERQQQPDQYSRPNEWSRRLNEGEWQRQQQWELEGGPSADWMPEERRGRERYGQQGRYGQQPGQGSQGGPYGMEYPESGYQSPGGYGQMYRGEMGQYSGQSRESMYGRGQYSGRGPKGYMRSDDRIREDVCERLTQAWEVDAEDIEVKVKDGAVTLTGTVMDRYQKRLAEDAVDSVPGVRDVNNQLRAGLGGMEREGQMATSGGGQYRSGGMSGSTRSGSSTRSGTGSRSTSSRSTTGSASGRGSTSSRSSSTTGSGSSRSSSARSTTPGARSGSTAARGSTAGRTSTAGRSSTSGAGMGASASSSRPSSTSSTRPSTPSPMESKPQSQDPFQPESR